MPLDDRAALVPVVVGYVAWGGVNTPLSRPVAPEQRRCNRWQRDATPKLRTGGRLS